MLNNYMGGFKTHLGRGERLGKGAGACRAVVTRGYCCSLSERDPAPDSAVPLAWLARKAVSASLMRHLSKPFI